MPSAVASESAASGSAIQHWTVGPSRPKVSIRKLGSIVFQMGAQKQFGIGTSIQHFTLAFDKRENRIICIPAKSSDDNALSLAADRMCRVLYCRGFLESMGIDFSKRRVYLLTKVDSYPGLKSSVPVYVIDLNSPCGDESPGGADGSSLES